jgi:uncharacterized protein YeaO (DUF488 family)/DNA-binding MarR family transcriptional regulator
MGLSHQDYARLLALRNGLRRFIRWSEQQAQTAGLTPNQHQLLLALRGHDDPRGPTIGEIADYLLLRHHSTVALVDRADAAGLVTRYRDPDDRRVVRLRLTEEGAERLEALSTLHLEELNRLSLQVPAAWSEIVPFQPTHGLPGNPAHIPTVRVARVYSYIPDAKARSILVDRVWPRGLSRTEASPFNLWLKDVAPSSELRQWYGQDPQRFEEFAERYRNELREPPTRHAFEQLQALARESDMVLLTATKEIERSSAAVLRQDLTPLSLISVGTPTR